MFCRTLSPRVLKFTMRLPILMVGALVACSAAPVPSLQQTLPASWQHPPVSSTTTNVNLQSWWTLFNAPELNTLVEQTIKENLQVAEAQERIRAARILSNNSGSSFRPELHFRTDELPSPSSTASYFRYGLDATWELGLFGRADSLRRIANSDLLQAESNKQAIRISVVGEVVRSWLDLRNAQRHNALFTQQLSTSTDRINLLEQRAALGLAIPNLLLDARMAQSRAQTAVLERNRDVEQAQLTLAILQGKSQPISGLSTTLNDVAEPTSFALAGLPIELLRARPDIQHAEAAVLKAAGELGIARADMFPHIALGASLFYSINTSSSLKFNANDRLNAVPAFGPIIDIPLFDWGRRQATKDARSALLNASLFAYRDAVLKAYAEAETALANLALENQRVSQVNRQLLITQQSQQAHQQLTTLGLSSVLDNLELNSKVLQVQLDALDAASSRDYAYIAVFKTLGGAALPSATPAALQKTAGG